MRPFYIRMTGRQIQEIYTREAAELELAAQICDEKFEEADKREAALEPEDQPDYGNEETVRAAVMRHVDGDLVSAGPMRKIGGKSYSSPFPLDYAPIEPLPSFFQSQAAELRESALEIRNFLKLIGSEETFDLGREDLHALGLLPRCFHIPVRVSDGIMGEAQKRRRQEH